MKPSMKMGVIALVGVCVVFYQYHLSTGVRFDQAIDFSAGGSIDDEVESHQIKFPRFTSDMVIEFNYLY